MDAAEAARRHERDARGARDRAEPGAAVGAQRALVPPGDPQAEAQRLPACPCVVEPGLDERLREPLAGEVRTHAEADAHLVVLADEVEEADEVAVVADDRAESVAPRRVREQLDASRVGRGVVPLVRELVPPRRDLRGMLLGHRLHLHGSEPTVATQRAAASRPRRAASSSEPPRRKPAANASPAPVVSTTSASTGARSRRASSVTTVAPRGPRLITPVGAVR